jgi:hypothetical protein
MSDFPLLGVAVLASVHGGAPRGASRRAGRVLTKLRTDVMHLHHALGHCKPELDSTTHEPEPEPARRKAIEHTHCGPGAEVK